MPDRAPAAPGGRLRLVLSPVVPGARIQEGARIPHDHGDFAAERGAHYASVKHGRPVIDKLTVYQRPLFSVEDPVIAELRELDVNGLSPLAALNKLYELQQRVRE